MSGGVVYGSAQKYPEFVDKPGERLVFTHQPVDFLAGVRCRQIVVYFAQLELCGELDVDEIIVIDPREGGYWPDGKDTDAVHLGGATGRIGELVTLDTGQDVCKVGRGTHDLVIDSWFSRAKPREQREEGVPSVHQDGFQFMNAQRVTIEHADYESPTGNNAGLWFNPISVGSADPGNAQNPDLVVDCVCNGGRIVNRNHGVHLGPSTRCGARNTLLVGKRPYAKLVNAPVVDPVDDQNTKIKVTQ
jgi:hypothetical protein